MPRDRAVKLNLRRAVAKFYRLTRHFAWTYRLAEERSQTFASGDSVAEAIHSSHREGQLFAGDPHTVGHAVDLTLGVIDATRFTHGAVRRRLGAKEERQFERPSSLDDVARFVRSISAILYFAA